MGFCLCDFCKRKHVIQYLSHNRHVVQIHVCNPKPKFGELFGRNLGRESHLGTVEKVIRFQPRKHRIDFGYLNHPTFFDALVQVLELASSSSYTPIMKALNTLKRLCCKISNGVYSSFHRLPILADSSKFLPSLHPWAGGSSSEKTTLFSELLALLREGGTMDCVRYPLMLAFVVERLRFSCNCASRSLRRVCKKPLPRNEIVRDCILL